MDYQQRDRLKLALDVYALARSESQWRAVEAIASVLEKIQADERRRAGNACDWVAGEWLDSDAPTFGSPAEQKLCRQLRAQAAKSAMICADRVDPQAKHDRSAQIAAYEKGEKT